MKKNYIFIIIIIFTLNGNLGAQSTCPDYIEHYWKFNENSPDSFQDIISGLTAKVGTVTEQVLGILDSSQYFNGTAEISVNEHTSFDWSATDSFTIEFWINKTAACPSNSAEKNNVIIGRDDPDTKLHWWAGVSCSNPGKITLNLTSKDGYGYELESKKGVIDGEWHHIAITRDGIPGLTSIYIDGKLDTSAVVTYIDDFESDRPVNIGWLKLGKKYRYNGILDELAIYGTALKLPLIASHYNKGEGRDYCAVDTASTSTGFIEGDITSFKVYPTIVTSDLNLQFSLTESQPVIINVYDITGNKVVELLNKQLNEGDHNLYFKSFTDDIHFAGNSVLILRMQLNNRSVSRKLLIGSR